MTASLPAGLALQSAVLQQNVALSALKAAAQADRQIANILQQAVDSVPVSGSRGAHVNTSA